MAEKPEKINLSDINSRKVDNDLLNELRDFFERAENQKERYEFTWNGKSKAFFDAVSPSTKTLLPKPEESDDFKNSKNIFITGDNLEVLKLLQESYLSKIDMIYIDPPYNTGTNLIYKNNFNKSELEEKRELGEIDEEGNILVQNDKSNGRFHSDWLSFIYPRLKISRNLLNDSGIISVAMDESESSNTQKLLDEIFGESNFIGTIVTKSNPQGRGKKNIDPSHEYHFLYAKNIYQISDLKIKNNKGKNSYSTLMRSGTNSRKFERPKRYYPMLVKNSKVYMISEQEYFKIYDNDKFNEQYINDLTKKYENKGYSVVFPIAKNGEEKVWQRMFERVKKEYHTYIFEDGKIKVPNDTTRTPMSLWVEKDFSNVQFGTNEVKELFDGISYFDYPKSINTVKQMLSLIGNKNALILDFFAGSGTTGQAVMQLNQEDEGNRKYILCTLDERTYVVNEGRKIAKDDNTSKVAFENGYESIDQISRDRIRRAAKKINDTSGFRALKVDRTRLNEKIFKSANELEQEDLLSDIDNQLNSRSNYALLYDVLIDSALEFNKQIINETIDGEDIIKYDYFGEGSGVIAYFDDNLTDNITQKIANLKPLIAVFKESTFNKSSQKVNVLEQFRIISPDTKVKVI
ncbi:site-specific DNA-methyltransferase [Staphylococcus saprophyticus]|uniref:site-specific DNA-methyltransferase n=1 Tax=Staphylococcus saprophyticus TaxID=29385 RepID=UPI000D1A3DE7|nr:site-specific DNA-methyltransferase [Staphylococcus saprophyticus]PTG66815.1 site-specific DNA-methyltransferase [Staphylococcus cohnii]RIO28296.1 site-specific DNA-methyltransferase [Staphylococcus saprophyticus]